MRRRYVIAVLLALAACTVDTSKPGTDPTTTTLPDRTKTIAGLIGLPIPITAEPRYARYQQGLDDNARLILSMSATDWAVMRSRPPLDRIAPAAYSGENQYLLPTDDGEWDPRSRRGLLAGQTPYDGRVAFNIGCVEEAGDRVRVYVFWHQL